METTATAAPGMERTMTFSRKCPFTRSWLGSSASTNDGMPMVNDEMSVIWMGWKGYCQGTTTNSTADTMDSSVFTRKSDAERWRLLMERRPSATTLGMLAKSLSTSTRCATFLAASLPAAIATLQSAAFKARVSLTPSPVMATVWPAFCSAKTKAFFCSGFTRPNTPACASAASTSASVFSVVASTKSSAYSMPTLPAMLETVRGSSPEMTMQRTPCSLK